MVKNLLVRAATVVALLVIAAGPLFAGDTDRERKVRVALALAGQPKAAPVAAPAPKEKAPDARKGDPAKKVCPCGGTCSCGGGCPACPAADLGKIRDAVVRVSCGNGSGSGTVIWSEGGRSVILTAAHVLGTGTDPRVRGNGRWHKAEVLGRDDAADLAVLLVATELPAVKVAEADPREGDDVLMVGVTSLWSEGRIVGREQYNGSECYLFGCDTGADDYSDSGDSGAGVFVRGELVAVHCGKVTLSERTPYAAGTRPVRALLARVFKRRGSKTEPVAIAVPPAVAKSAPAQSTCPGGSCPAPSAGIASPSFGGCANGQCPAPTGRRGFFRR